MDKVMVLMSTYNGEKYLGIQLDSILNQEGVDVHILVRDDGSKDNTRKILRGYANVHNNISILEDDNCGAILSFYSLMDYAVKHYSDYKYFAFSDQDDYWYPNKLERAISMNTDNLDNYFYHSCYEIVDGNLDLICKSTNTYTIGTLGEALIANHSIGCSEVFTYDVLTEAAKICNYHLDNPRYYPYHDLWMYLVALATKAKIVFDDYCSLKYRQHGNNVIGVGRGRIETMIFQYKNLVKTKNLKSGFARILLDLIDADDEIRRILMLSYEYRLSLLFKMKLLMDKEYCIHGFINRLAFKYSVIRGLF